jgi:hypothetical protein
VKFSAPLSRHDPGAGSALGVRGISYALVNFMMPVSLFPNGNITAEISHG